MNTIKTLTLAAALIAGSMSLAVAQNGLPTGGEPPVAGGANGNPANGGMSPPSQKGSMGQNSMGQSSMGQAPSHKSNKKQDN
jgi:hypothetical protein